ncbi:hypothetical protein G4V62_17980 [Bacillaceae bacterium SIJ1]|uniref:ABC transporter permease n=1 Tax=Litoribacterium kuwaitense TaxID=1398745 RepID=UPI0013EA1FB4|nr:ABC-2 family transporter protein [Litoribacterium kuwaitense]NGP46740.1 hypothetical protein [Litoribacterium kuwaitense]
MSITLFYRYILTIFKVRMEYRVDFILGAFGQIFGYAANFLVVWILLQEFKVIDGWLWPEMALLISLSILTYALGSTFFYTPMTSIDQIIINGDFDKYLIKPLNPLMNLVASMFNYGYIAHLIISVSVLIWSMTQLSIQWDAVKLIYLMLCIISGAFLQAAFFVIIGSLSFKFLRVSYLFSLLFKVKDFVNYPLSIYFSWIQVALTWIIPLAFINYYPSLFILDKDISPFFIVITPLVGPLFFLLSLVIWSRFLNQYQGTGS